MRAETYPKTFIDLVLLVPLVGAVGPEPLAPWLRVTWDGARLSRASFRPPHSPCEPSNCRAFSPRHRPEISACSRTVLSMSCRKNLKMHKNPKPGGHHARYQRGADQESPRRRMTPLVPPRPGTFLDHRRQGLSRLGTDRYCNYPVRYCNYPVRLPNLSSARRVRVRDSGGRFGRVNEPAARERRGC